MFLTVILLLPSPLSVYVDQGLLEGLKTYPVEDLTGWNSKGQYTLGVVMNCKFGEYERKKDEGRSFS